MLKRQSGLTLVELAVAVAVIAIGASIAAPSISRISAGYKVRSTAEGMMAALNYARAESVRRNVPVSFAVTSNGWNVSQASPSTVLTSFAREEMADVVIQLDGTTTSVTFMPNGLLQGGSQLRQVVVSSLSDTTSRRIKIFGGGLIRMCDPSVSSSNDPRAC